MKAVLKVLGALLFFLAYFRASALDIVKDGKAEAVIIVDEKSLEMTRYAAKEFKDYIRKASGIELPIKDKAPKDKKNLIFIGGSSYTKEKGIAIEKLSHDGFKIICKDNYLALLGKDYKGKRQIAGTTPALRLFECYDEKSGLNRFGETGTLFAVYAFLEDFCGIRWYMSGKLGEVVPENKNISVGEINISRSPDFHYRCLLHCVFKDDPDAAIWYRRAGFGAAFPVGINHSFAEVFKKERKEKSCPECFALIDGKRDYKSTCMGKGNLCLSEKKVLDKFVDAARKYFDSHPEQFIFPVMPNDSLLGICGCPKCRAQAENTKGRYGKYSFYIWNFVNKVAIELAKTHPDKFIGCCAYGAYRMPPENIKFSPNVVVMITKSRSEYWNKRLEKKIGDFLDAWSGKVKTIYIWEYYNWPRFRPFLCNVPVFFPHIIQRDLKKLKGVSGGEFIEAETWPSGSKPQMNYPGLTHLNFYLTGKLMWDVNADIDALLNEYYEKFYGPAAVDMKKFWNLSEKIWSSDSSEKLQQSDYFDFNLRDARIYDYLYTEDKVAELAAHLDSALKKTKPGSQYRERVELIMSEFMPLKERVSQIRKKNKAIFYCPYAAKAPVIDGVLDDPCWKLAPPSEFHSILGEKPEFSTKLYLAWDEKNLYFALDNYEPQILDLRTDTKTRDAREAPWPWCDDSIEIFLDPHKESEKTYYHIIMTASGVIWDSFHRNVGKSSDKSGDLNWNSSLTLKTLLNKSNWTVEGAIPFKDFGVSPFGGMKLSGNFCRTRSCRKGLKYSNWAPVFDADFHSPERFGTIILKKD